MLPVQCAGIGGTKLSDTQNPSNCSHNERAGDIVLNRVHVLRFLFYDLFEVLFEIITFMIVRRVLRIGTHGGKHVNIGIAVCIFSSFYYSKCFAKETNIYST